MPSRSPARRRHPGKRRRSSPPRWRRSPTKLEPAAAPEPKSPRPWSFKRTLHSPSRTPKRFFGSKPDDVEPKKLWEDGDASDAGDAPPRVSLEELDEFVDVVALNKRTGARSIIRLARGTVMSDAAYAQHTKSDTKKLVFVRGDGTEKGKSLSPKARVADLRRPAAAEPRGGRRASAESPRSPSTSRSGTAPWRSATTPGTRSASDRSTLVKVALPLNRAEIRPDVEYMELSIDLGDEPPPLETTPLRELAEAAAAGDGRHGAFSGKSPPPSPGWSSPVRTAEAGVG